MTSEEIFDLARKRTPPPDSLTLSEQMLYTIARNIYKAYADKTITLEQAKDEKAAAVKSFNDKLRAENEAERMRRQAFRISEELNAAIMNGIPVKHSHMGITCTYTIRGVITRYSPEKGWTNSLELADKAGCVVYAALEDTEILKGGSQ